MKVELDVNKVSARIGQRISKAQFLLDQQVAKDSNLYCPEDVGTLQDSVLPSANGKGELVWNEPYAKKQYYELPDKSKDKNPRAVMKWFEAAKSVFLKRWEKLANDRYNQ